MSERLDWERARFVDWPADRADAYRAARVWAGQTLFDAVARTASGAAERVAVIDDAEALSYGQLVDRAERLAGGLRTLGLARGDAAVVQLPNTIDFVLTALACFRVGVRPIMALPALRLSELGHLASTAQAAAVIVPSVWREFDHEAMAHRTATDVDAIRTVVVTGTPRLQESVAFADLMANDVDRGPQPPPSDLALFLLSGGTTGLPKLIPRTHDDYLYNALLSAEICEFDQQRPVSRRPPGRTQLSTRLPRHRWHAAQRRHGGDGRITRTRRRNGGHRTPRRHHHRGGSRCRPTMDRRRRRLPRRPLPLAATTSRRLAAGRRARSSGRAETRLPSPASIRHGRGSPQLHPARPIRPQVVWTTQGRPASEHDEIRILDGAGTPVADGQIGELWTRGPYTICGYFNADAHNHTTFAG